MRAERLSTLDGHAFREFPGPLPFSSRDGSCRSRPRQLLVVFRARRRYRGGDERQRSERAAALARPRADVPRRLEQRVHGRFWRRRRSRRDGRHGCGHGPRGSRRQLRRRRHGAARWFLPSIAAARARSSRTTARRTNRVNYVIVGDGYTDAELTTTYLEHIQTYMTKRFSDPIRSGVPPLSKLREHLRPPGAEHAHLRRQHVRVLRQRFEPPRELQQRAVNIAITREPACDVRSRLARQPS